MTNETDTPAPTTSASRASPSTPTAADVASRFVALLVVVLAAVPAFAGRALLQDLFFVFTMLALAQYWNLLAGYAGLVSVGQQAFVGLGAYALFAATLIADLDPLIAILLGGVVAAVLALPTALVVFRLRGAYFAIGTWVAAEVFRLILAQVKQLGGGTGTSLGPDITNQMAGLKWIAEIFGVRISAARDIANYWLALALLVGTLALVFFLLRSRRGLALAAIRDSETAADSLGVDGFRTKLVVYVADRLRHRHGRRADLSAEGAHLARRRLLGARLDRLRDLHRGDRRHRHDRGADHRRDRPLSAAGLSRDASAPGT